MLSLCNAELEFFLKRHPLEFCFCFGRNFKIVWTNSRPFSLPSVLLSSLFLFTYSCEPKPSTIRKAKIFGKGRCEGGGPRIAAQNPPMDIFCYVPRFLSFLLYDQSATQRNAPTVNEHVRLARSNLDVQAGPITGTKNKIKKKESFKRKTKKRLRKMRVQQRCRRKE